MAKKGGRVPVQDRISSSATLLLRSLLSTVCYQLKEVMHMWSLSEAAAASPSAGFSSKCYQEKALPSLRALTRSQHSGDNRRIHRRFHFETSALLLI